MKRVAWCAACALLWAPLALSAPPADAPKTVSDQDFVQQASAANLAEINLGHLAVTQAANDDVKKFGQRMVDDHTKLNDELNKAADKAGVTPAPTMDAAHQALFTKLSGMKGADFDHQYITAMVADHKDAVGLFQAEAKNGKIEGLKAVAEKGLPIIQQHLEMAEKLNGPQPAATSTSDKKPEDVKKPEKDK